MQSSRWRFQPAQSACAKSAGEAARRGDNRRSTRDRRIAAAVCGAARNRGNVRADRRRCQFGRRASAILRSGQHGHTAAECPKTGLRPPCPLVGDAANGSVLRIRDVPKRPARPDPQSPTSNARPRSGGSDIRRCSHRRGQIGGIHHGATVSLPRRHGDANHRRWSGRRRGARQRGTWRRADSLPRGFVSTGRRTGASFCGSGSR